MNWADWSIVAILALSSLISLKRGFVKEALSLIVWAAAFIIAMLFSGRLSTLLVDAIATPSIREMAAFAILFIAALIVGAMVNYLVSTLVKMTGLSGTDRLLGMVFGVARGLIVVMAILLLLPSLIPIDQDSWWQQSLLIPHFLSFEGWARGLAGDVSALISSLF